MGDWTELELTPNGYSFLLDYFVAKEKIPVLPKKQNIENA